MRVDAQAETDSQAGASAERKTLPCGAAGVRFYEQVVNAAHARRRVGGIVFSVETGPPARDSPKDLDIGLRHR